MITANNIRVGQGIYWTDPEGLDMYGAVLGKKEGSISAVPVYPLMPGDRCYNDVGIVKGDVNYLVRLKDCPPPFSGACEDSPFGQCCAYADLKHPITLSDRQLCVMCARLSDGGKKLSKRDFQAIFDCAKHGTPEKQLSGPASSGTEKKPAPPDMGKPVQNTTYMVKSTDRGISKAAPAEAKKLPPVGPKTVQAETAPAAPKPPSKTLKQGFSDVETAVEAQASRSQPRQAKSKSWSSARPLGRLADLAENLGMMEDDGPDFGL